REFSCASRTKLRRQRKSSDMRPNRSVYFSHPVPALQTAGGKCPPPPANFPRLSAILRLTSRYSRASALRFVLSAKVAKPASARIALIDRFELCARWPEKSSVES